MSLLPLVRLWIWISVLATVAGWTLSALSQLNQGGYLVFFCLGAFLLWRGRGTWAPEWQGRLLRCKAPRFRRALPLAFLVLTFLVLLGGFIYPPTNHTALTYRTPRVLQWLAEGHWFWIHTSNYRMNNRACGLEWLSAPLLLFTRSDRGLFLINFVPFLLMPGLVFSLFTRLGVRPGVAWQWMWLLATGYTFLLQAGSAGNDAFPTVYALAAVDFACRTWVSRRPSDLWHSVLAAALLTGAKASNLPLLLPWLVALVPLLITKQPALSGGREVASGPGQGGSVGHSPLATRHLSLLPVMIPLALLVSFLPTAILNVHYCGDWSGLSLERTGMDMKSPLVGIWGNASLFLLDNLVPPFFPAAGWWNQHALSVLPQAIVAPLVANFELSFHWLWELPTEDWVGLGFGLSWLTLIAVIAARRLRPALHPDWAREEALPQPFRKWAAIAAWVALLAYCVKSGMSTGARLISPYYPLLLPLLLAGSRQAPVIRSSWWRVMVWIVVGLAFPVLVLTPARPLWPARAILSHVQQLFPQEKLVMRALNVYSVYGARSDPLASVRSLLPADLTMVGFMGRGDDPDISFWRPFGQRRVENLLITDSAAEIRRRSVEYVVAGDYNFGINGTTFAAWQQQTGAELVATTNATVRVSEGPQPGTLCGLRQANSRNDRCQKSMNWALMRHFPWLDTRVRFVAATPAQGALLDLGSAEGGTLGHIAELRPDLRLFAVDKCGQPANYPVGCKFQQADLERDSLIWGDASMDAINCTHLVEHLHDSTRLIAEAARVLKPGGRVYFETPHPKSLVLSSPRGVAAGTFPLNFYDDYTHVRPVSMGALAQWVRSAGLEVVASGISRNWLFAAAYPAFAFMPASRRKFTARLHWLGWSAYLIARKPAAPAQ